MLASIHLAHLDIGRQLHEGLERAVKRSPELDSIDIHLQVYSDVWCLCLRACNCVSFNTEFLVITVLQGPTPLILDSYLQSLCESLQLFKC